MNYRIVIFAVALLSVLPSSAREWSLDECIQHAISHNLTIKRQELNVEQQEIALNTSRYSRLPDLSGSFDQNFNFGRALTSDNIYDNKNTQSTSFGLSSSAPIISGGRIYYDVKEKKLNLQAALSECQTTKESVTLNVTSAYLEALCQKELVETARHQADLSQQQVERMQKLFENGKTSEAEVAQIRSTHASDMLSLAQQQNSYMLSLLSLSQLLELETPEGFDVCYLGLGDTKDSKEELSVILPSPDEVYSQAIAIKPSIQTEQIRLKSALNSVTLARTALYPSLNLNGGIGTSYYHTSGYLNDGFSTQMRNNFSQYIGLSLSVPIFNRLATRNSIRSAKVQVRTQQIVLDETKKALYKDIQQAYYNALAAQRQCESSDVALESSQTAFNLMQKKYENGKANATEFQESKTNLARAQSNVITARFTFVLRQKILNFYCGGDITK